MKTAILQSFKKKKGQWTLRGEGQVCPSQAVPLTALPLAPACGWQTAAQGAQTLAQGAAHRLPGAGTWRHTGGSGTGTGGRGGLSRVGLCVPSRRNPVRRGKVSRNVGQGAQARAERGVSPKDDQSAAVI